MTERAGFSRREAMNLLGASAGLGLVTAWSPLQARAAQFQYTSTRKLTFPRGAIIRTNLKDFSPDALAGGATMVHEHVYPVGGGYASPPSEPRQPGSAPPAPTPQDDARFLDLMVEELRGARADGLGCIVDAAIGRRGQRELDHLRQMASRSGMHIIVAGGYFLAPRYPPDIIKLSEDQIADHLVEMANAERWGAFGEIGTSMEMHPDERKFLSALSKAHQRTGIPIFTHTEHQGCARCALDQLDLLESKGVNLKSLYIGHLTDIKPDAEPLGQTAKAIAKRGAFIGFDTVGHEMRGSSIPEAHKVKYVVEILDAGYEDNLLLSADFSQAAQLKANWGLGFSTVLLQFVPKLRHAGVKDDTIRKILVDNPRRFLAFVPKAS